MSHERVVEQRRAQLTEAFRVAFPPTARSPWWTFRISRTLATTRSFSASSPSFDSLGGASSTSDSGATYRVEQLRRRIGRRPVLLHGGGNLGDLWPSHQRLRERLLTDLRDHPIVQLPQSIAFDSDDSIACARRAFEAHPNFTLLVRDEPSRQFAEHRLGTPACLVPDAAFGLGTLRRPHPHPGSARTGPDGPRGEARPTTARRRGDGGLGGAAARGRRQSPRDVRTGARPAPRPRDSNGGRARPRIDLGARQGLSRALESRPRSLSSARVVVTDRLHAHVLSLLLGIPHVVTDSVSGKIRGLYKAWSAESELVTWADSLEEAVRVGRRLADDVLGLSDRLGGPADGGGNLRPDGI